MAWADRLERDPTFVSRQIAGETILVPIRQNMGDLESVYSVNEVGTRVWELLDGSRTLGDIRDRIADEFEVGMEALARDLLEFLKQLQAIRAVRPAALPAGGSQP
ncbi:MAG TPA: PqqD family protein [Candidatus Sulfotelmatobacter sp.]|nr:PqqD family protein [Candidatus Sulfotelmatobacter sp.]